MANQVATTRSRDVAKRYDGGETTRARALFRPRTDIYETEDSVIVLSEMPGVGPDDVEITLERGVLTVRGRTPDAPHEGYQRVYAEYAEGDYERAFVVSEDIERDSIKATHKNGLLVLELPKAPAARSKKIQVKAA
jgi:HSP20 family protein